MLQYILEVTLCWALFYLIFFGLLRKLTFFSVNRWYLLGSLVLGMLIPQLRHIEFNMYQEEISESLPIAIMVKEIPAQVVVTVEEVSASVEWSDILADVLWGVYIIGLAFFGFRLLRSLYRIYRLHMDGRKEVIDGASIIYTQSEHLPFSFWNTVYISDQVELTEEFQDILEHERAHVKSWHSIDVLLLELIQIAFWFNPMIYLYKTALRQTHEYLADAAVLRHTSRQTYGTMLLKQSLSGLEIALTHQFFHSHIKKRINMMYQKKSGRSAWLKYALAVPVLFVLTVVFANRKDNALTNTETELITKESDVKVFGKSALIAQLTALNLKAENSHVELEKSIYDLIKDYLQEYPSDQEEILRVLAEWGSPYKYIFIYNFDQGIVKYVHEKYPIQDINSFTLELKRLSDQLGFRIELNRSHVLPDADDLEKSYKSIKNLDRSQQANLLRLYILRSSSLSHDPGLINDLNEIFRDFLKSKKLDIDIDLDQFTIRHNSLLNDELRELSKTPLIDLSNLNIWTDDWDQNLSLNEMMDINKPIDVVYYLPPSEATKIFGNSGSKGFYTIMGYERPISHPEKQREMLDFEMDNFFKTLANDVNERAWIKKLKEIHEKMQQRYPKVGDWVTPFTTKAHKYNINLVIKNKEIIAAYRDGVERIDEPLNDDKVYKVVQEMPRFPGCELMNNTEVVKKECADEKLLEYIYDNLRYPKVAKENRIEGRVYVQFIVEKDGTISDAKIVRDIGAGCGSEALRVVEHMNQLYERWSPGKEKGETVRVQYTMPFTFKLDDPDELPLYIIDGTIVDEITFEDYFKSENIHQFNGLSETDAVAKYGERGKNGAHEIISKKDIRIENVLSPSDRNIFTIASREPYLKEYITYKTIKLRFAESQKEYKVDLYKYYEGESQRDFLEYFITDVDLEIIDAKEVRDDGYFIFNLKNSELKTIDIEVVYFDKKEYDRYLSQKEERHIEPINDKIKEAVKYDTVIVYNPETFTETMTIVPRHEDTHMTFPGGSPTSIDEVSQKKGLDPLYIIDGKEYSRDEINSIDPNDIKEVHVIKNKLDLMVYGDRGKDGVVIITLNEGVTIDQTTMDTVIIYDPVTFTETIIVRDHLDEDFSIKLTYEKDVITLKSNYAFWKELTFTLNEGQSQIIDYNGLTDQTDHEAQFSFEIIKDDNQFTFRNKHGFDWVELETNCKKWIYSHTEITKSGVEINCF